MAGRARAIKISLAPSDSEGTLDAATWTKATQVLLKIKRRQVIVGPAASKYTAFPLICEKTSYDLVQEGVYVA